MLLPNPEKKLYCFEIDLHVYSCAWTVEHFARDQKKKEKSKAKGKKMNNKEDEMKKKKTKKRKIKNFAHLDAMFSFNEERSYVGVACDWN